VDKHCVLLFVVIVISPDVNYVFGVAFFGNDFAAIAVINIVNGNVAAEISNVNAGNNSQPVVNILCVIGAAAYA
jgi:hypothetical protein